MSSTTRYREVTAKQLADGWSEFGGLTAIPNVVRREYVVVRRLANGNAIVIDPGGNW